MHCVKLQPFNSNEAKIATNNKILIEMQSQYKHIIIDEFQDNNYALSRIIERIAQPENSITVGGDDDQCIYAFRQANIQNVHQFQEHYFISSQIPISLLKNYRSNQHILNVANSVISENSGRISKGDRILLQGFGAGFTWGTTLLTL